MKTKVLQVFYNENGLPFKDQERTVHFPVIGSGFMGASNTTQIKFYFKEIGDDAVKYVAVSKLPNGKVGSKVLENYFDSELNEPYALLELDSYYTQYKGDLFISLQGYQGGVQVTYDEDTELYEIEGTPTIQATGSIKFTNNYATQFVGSGEEQNITLQQLLAIISDTVLRYYVNSSNTLAEVFNEIGTKICAVNIEGDEYLCEMSGDTNIVLYDIHNQEWYAFSGANTTTIDEVMSSDNKQVIATKEDLENFGNLFTYKGTASVAQINALTNIGNGWCYNLTDSGTLTLGNLSVETGDNVAFNGTIWTKLSSETVLGQYYTKQEGQEFEQDVNNRVSNVENELSSVASGSPKGVYATLADLQAAYPTGTTGIYLVVANGHWYYWSGSAWTDGGAYLSSPNVTYYSGKQLKDTNGNELYPNTDLTDVGTNLFNPVFCTTIGYYAYNSGVYNSSATTYRSIEYIKVEPNTTYIINKSYIHISYWKDNNYVGGVTSGSSANFTFTTPSSVDFIKVSLNQTGIASFMLIKGSTLPSSYIAYKETIKDYIKVDSDNVDFLTDINNLTDDVKNYLMDRFIPTMEMGNIAYGPDQWYYSTSTTRVRTPQGYLIPLHKGDIIKLTSYSNARMYIGWKTIDGTLYNSGRWYTEDFVVTQDGYYAILLCNLTDTTVTNVSDLSSLLRVYRYNYITDNVLTNIENNLYENMNRLCNVKSINHRGYSVGAPENTLPAYKLSKLKGFDYVECDVSFTSDKVPVLLHDDTIDRTSNGTGNINDLTYAYVRTLDFGSWFSPAYAGTKIPSFEEFISLCKKLGLKPYVEIKVSATYTLDDIKILTDIVKKYGMKEDVTWISFSITYLGYVHTLLPKARLGYVLYEITSTNIAEILALKDDNEIFIDEYYVYLTSSIISDLIENDIPLEVYIIDTESVLLSQDNYVTGITSNSLNAGQVLYAKGMEMKA